MIAHPTQTRNLATKDTSRSKPIFFVFFVRFVADFVIHNFSTIRPRVLSAGINATLTRSPTRTRM